MQDINSLLQDKILWNAEIRTNEFARKNGAEVSDGPQTFFSEGLSHEFFFDYSDNLVSHPPASLIFSYLKDTCIEAWSAQGARRLVICIGRDVWPSPYFLRDCFRETSFFENFLFLNPANEKQQLKALETALRSESVVAVVTNCKKLSFSFTQKILLLAKNSRARSFIFRNRKEMKMKSSAYSRWMITPVVSNSELPCWKMALLSSKGSQATQKEWIMELSDEKALPLCLLPELVDKSDTEKATYLHCA